SVVLFDGSGSFGPLGPVAVTCAVHRAGDCALPEVKAVRAAFTVSLTLAVFPPSTVTGPSVGTTTVAAGQSPRSTVTLMASPASRSALVTLTLTVLLAAPAVLPIVSFTSGAQRVALTSRPARLSARCAPGARGLPPDPGASRRAPPPRRRRWHHRCVRTPAAYRSSR